MKRVVITGVGSISSLGEDTATLIAAIEAGQSGVRQMTAWNNYIGLHSLVAAPVITDKAKDIPRKYRRCMGPMAILGAIAGKQAIEDAKLTPEELQSGRVGCIMGSTMGSAESLYDIFDIILPDNDLSLMPSTQFFKCVSHTVAMNTAQYLKISGLIMATSAACASSMQAIGLGYDLIKLGRQDVILCGGAEETHASVTSSFDVLYATSSHFNDTPQQTPRPFDENRDGLVCGGAGATLVLEEYQRAKKRGATIYAELIGFNTLGGGGHISQSNKSAIIKCITSAIQDANISTNDIDYINAHATATIQGDHEEAEAIREIFGDRVPVSSLKGNLGHTLGASGALELIISIIMMQKNILYPTKNLHNIAPDCQGIQHIQQIKKHHSNIILKNCFAFGGINAAIICKKI